MLVNMDDRLVGIDDLLEVWIVDGDMGKWVIGIVGLKALKRFFLTPITSDGRGGKDAPRKISAMRKEENFLIVVLESSGALVDLRQVLMCECFVHTHVVVSPGEMRRGTGLLSGSGRSSDGVDMDIGLYAAMCGEGQKSELNTGRKAARIGDSACCLNAIALPLGQAIDKVVLRAFHPELIAEIDDLDRVGQVYTLKEWSGAAMAATEEDGVDICLYLVGKDELGLSDQVLMDAGHRPPGLAGRMHKLDLDLWMIHKNAQEFSRCIAGSADDAD